MKNEKPKLILIAGPNGSGKTTITKQLLKHNWSDDCFYINPDNIALEKFGDWNSQDQILKAAEEATQLRYNLLESKESIILETVFSSKEKIDFIKKAKDLDYFIRIFFIGTNQPTINISRVGRRVLKGGHTVPIDKIISRYYSSINNCINSLKIADRIYLVDNSIDDANPKMIFRIADGKIETKYSDLNNWTRKIYDVLNNN